MTKRHSYIFAVIMLLCAAPAQADHIATHEYRPAILFENGAQKSDRAFMEAARVGAELAHKNLGIHYTAYELPINDDREKILRTMIEKGATNIIAVGFQNVVPVLNLAKEFPSIRFTVIDGVVPSLFPNVQSILFRDNEGAFLVGMVAAYTSKTGTIGFIGGMDVPLIRNFYVGYAQGAKRVKPKITILSDMIGNTRDAWSNPARGAVLAQKQFDMGADIIFAAAGGSGLGALGAAKQARRYAIGVDTNQNALYPGTVLTSMVKRVDKAIYEALRNGRQDVWKSGTVYLGLQESALDFAVDNHNRDLISRETIDKVEAAKDLIVRGLIEVKEYNSE